MRTRNLLHVCTCLNRSQNTLFKCNNGCIAVLNIEVIAMTLTGNNGFDYPIGTRWSLKPEYMCLCTCQQLCWSLILNTFSSTQSYAP